MFHNPRNFLEKMTRWRVSSIRHRIMLLSQLALFQYCHWHSQNWLVLPWPGRPTLADRWGHITHRLLAGAAIGACHTLVEMPLAIQTCRSVEDMPQMLYHSRCHCMVVEDSPGGIRIGWPYYQIVCRIVCFFSGSTFEFKPSFCSCPVRATLLTMDWLAWFLIV